MANAEHSIALAHACWDGLLARYSWSTSTAFSVMMCESHGNPHDHNSSGATGLMQVIRPGASFDPETNMAQAWEKYVGSGGDWDPWNASAYCWRSKRNG
jgi:soluble lytic murein transglycosylase-like protein